MLACCSRGKAEAGLGRTAGLGACDCGVPARRAVRGPAPRVEIEPRARWQKELRAMALSRLGAPCPRDARATSAVAQMTLRMQSVCLFVCLSVFVVLSVLFYFLQVKMSLKGPQQFEPVGLT